MLLVKKKIFNIDEVEVIENFRVNKKKSYNTLSLTRDIDFTEKIHNPICNEAYLSVKISINTFGDDYKKDILEESDRILNNFIKQLINIKKELEK